MITEALTLARNFGPWFAGVAVAGFLAGNVTGWKAGRMYSGHEVAVAEKAQGHAEQQLADFKTSFAQATAEGERNVAALLAQAEKARAQHDARQEAAVAAIPALIAAQWQTDLTKFRESINAPQYDCLRLPLPDGTLRLFERPGGVAPTGR